jgi:hypothetical protein
MMMSSLYYPPLERQVIEEYYKSEGKFYATYNNKRNYTNVAKDCKHRCVYCDAHVDECGGEPFSLDHFRPMEVFGDKFDGILKTHPFNLHLSCQKCNVLKTNDWKGCRSAQDGVTYSSNLGYIDRFQVDITDYIKVDTDGRVQCINSRGPAKYMIEKLLLNRTNRVFIRKKREVKEKAVRIHTMLIKKQKVLFESLASKKLTDEEAIKKMKILQNMFDKFNNLKLIQI